MTEPRFDPEDLPDLDNTSPSPEKFSAKTHEQAKIFLDWISKGQSIGPLIISQTVTNIDGPDAPILYDLGFSIGLVSALFPSCLKIYDEKDDDKGEKANDHLLRIFSTVMQGAFHKLGYDTTFLISIKKRQDGTNKEGSTGGEVT